MFGQLAQRRSLGNRRRSRARSVRGGIKAKFLAIFVLLLIVIGALPIIVAKTPLRNALISAALPRDAVTVTVGDASLNWFGGPSLSSVEVKDSTGDSLLAAESLKVDRTPIQLALNSYELGTIQVVRPVIHVKVRPDGSNLEDILQKLAPAESDSKPKNETASAKSSTNFTFQLVDATILADDVATGRQWRLQKVNAQYDTHGATTLGLGSVTGDIAVSDRGSAALPAGRFSLALKTADGGLQQVIFQADQIALALAEPWLRRYAPGGQLSGTLSGQATAAWAQGQTPLTGLTTVGSLSVDRLDASTAAFAGDRIRLARIEMPWQLTAQPTGLAIESLQFRSDVGQAAVRGRIDPNLTTGHHDLELRGSIDIAKLAAMLPRAMHIRSDTTITSGKIDLSAGVKPTADGQAITGSITTAQIAATKAGKQLSWDQPVNANFAIRRSTNGIMIDAVRCDSKFLRVEASGTPEQLTANASFDLNALSDQLGQFVDLSGVQLAGTGSSQIAWQQAADGKFAVKAATDFAQLQVAIHEGAVWSEPQLTIRAEAGGSMNPKTHQPARVDTAQLQVNGQGDQLDARLASAVDLSNNAAVFPITVRSTGSIARWLTRVRPWFAPGGWNIDGASDFTADLRVAGNAFDATNTKLTITNLQAANADWNINESRIEFTGDARFNGATGELAANSAQLVSSTVAIAAKGLHYGGNQPGASGLSGAGAFRTDLSRLAAWHRSATQPPQYQTGGEFTGNVRFAQQAGRITGEINATGQNVVLASLAQPTKGGAPAGGYQTIWQEPRVVLQGTTNYDTAADRLSFDGFQIQSNTLQANAAGQIQKLSTTGECDLKGTLNYDLAQVTPLLRPYLGTGVALQGREQARFAMGGQLSSPSTISAQTVAYTPGSQLPAPGAQLPWSRRIRAQLELPWSGANLYGLPIGGGRLAAKLGDGSLQIDPIKLTVGEGQLTAAPNIRFDPEPAELTMPAGPVLTNVRISPEVSEAMLKFVAPVLAGATQSEGLFSLQLEGARVPLNDPNKADSKGQLTVHSVRVTPGPMTAQWAGLAQQVEALVKRRDPATLNGRQVTLVSVRDQQVNFQVANGRVYHQQVEFQIGDVIMRSQGSVGLDETVQLTIEIPIQDAWVAKEPLLSGLKGQSVQIPVGGTLKRPQMDNRAIASLTGQLLQKGAGQAVGNELNRALDKFLKPRQQQNP